MTPLEQQIFNALINLPYVDSGDKGVMARVAAKIALELAFKSFKEGNGYQEDMSEELQQSTFNQFIQDY